MVNMSIYILQKAELAPVSKTDGLVARSDVRRMKETIKQISLPVINFYFHAHMALMQFLYESSFLSGRA